MKKIFLPAIILALALSSCVSKKNYKKKVIELQSLDSSYQKVHHELDICLKDKNNNNEKISKLESELEYVKSVSTTLLKQLNDLSIITNSQSESIKKSLENINSKDLYIKGLQKEISRKDSLNMALVLSLKGALKDVNDKDIQINVEGSAVFISISDKMLFKSGSYEISPEAKNVLGKVADVIKAQPNIQFMVEGHTDNKPIFKGQIKDNWDLSVLRATAVVRLLQLNYGIEPNRMIAAGRSEYVSIAPNTTEEGKALNRRTRIVILPELDQFFKLLETK
ncbi:MAG: flagellar motor protein MotB [Bacteroidia bacterium]|nr:flagellar motor protein MotB [Bacteroidia bacterium]